jgi:nucleotide-binding universal stress UspA family protein
MGQHIDTAETAAPRRPRVVVGIDGSPGSRAALLQAYLAAARRGAHLVAVAAYSIELYWFGGAPLDVPDVDHIRDDTQRRAEAQLGEIRDEVDVSAVPGIRDVHVDLVVASGPAAHVLVEEARGADLLVVGSRGRGAARSVLLGSVGLHCATHAACPVLVVHTDAVAAATPPRVVVGVDGSDASRAALAAAIEEATSRRADVDVVVSVEVTDYWTDLGSVVVPSLDQIRSELHRRTEHLLTEAAEHRSPGEVMPHTRVVVAEGSAGAVLVQHSRTADLLVVGSRGHGAFRGLLLGSIALECAMHAACPVLVVHPQRARTAAANRTQPALADH